MWTLRDMFAADPEGTLRALAGIGYVQIELADIPPGHTAASLRALLDSVGSRAYSGHDGSDPSNFNEAAYRGQLERAVTLGQRQTGFAWSPGPYTEAYFKALAVQLNRAGAIAREYGLRFFYHNHDFEFTTLRADGRPVYTVLLEETDPSLVRFHMDLMRIHYGGGPWRELLTTMSDPLHQLPRQGPVAGGRARLRMRSLRRPRTARRAARGDARDGRQPAQPAIHGRARLASAPADHGVTGYGARPRRERCAGTALHG
jgi:hypothetical protein